MSQPTTPLGTEEGFFASSLPLLPVLNKFVFSQYNLIWVRLSKEIEGFVLILRRRLK
jgi:hypothetical protein